MEKHPLLIYKLQSLLNYKFINGLTKLILKWTWIKKHDRMARKTLTETLH